MIRLPLDRAKKLSIRCTSCPNPAPHQRLRLWSGISWKEDTVTGMPEHIFKGPIFRRLDERYRDPLKRRESLEKLKDLNRSVADIGDEHGVLLTRQLEVGELEREALQRAEDNKAVMDVPDALPSPTGKIISDRFHVLRDWFTPWDPTTGKGGWWLATVGPVEEILRQGLIQALEVSLPESWGGTGPEDRFLPVETLWICHGHDTDPDPATFECHVCWNEQQVTLCIMTPEEPGAHHDEPAPSRQPQTEAEAKAREEREKAREEREKEEAERAKVEPRGMIVIKVAGVRRGVIVKRSEPRARASQPRQGASSG